jgi:hypothetical protein
MILDRNIPFVDGARFAIANSGFGQISKINLLLIIGALPFAAAMAQTAGTNSPVPLNWTASQDRQNMMEQLGINRCDRVRKA